MARFPLGFTSKICSCSYLFIYFWLFGHSIIFLFIVHQCYYYHGRFTKLKFNLNKRWYPSFYWIPELRWTGGAFTIKFSSVFSFSCALIFGPSVYVLVNVELCQLNLLFSWLSLVSLLHFFFTWSGSGNILEFVVYDDLFCTEDGAFCPSLVPFMFTAWSFQFTGLFFWPHAMLLSLLEFVLLNLKLLPRILLFLLFLSLYFVCWNELWKW